MRSLRDAAARAGVRFLFEGAVMDGIPIFNLVRETLPAVDIIGFEGVVNTTTNHIITALEAGARSRTRWRGCRRKASPKRIRRSTWTAGTRRRRRRRSPTS